MFSKTIEGDDDVKNYLQSKLEEVQNVVALFTSNDEGHI